MLYTIWCAVWFVSLYLVLFPIQFVFLQRNEWKPLAHKINYLWGRLFFMGAGIPVRVEHRFRPDPKGVYVLCANHFSYLDIAAMGVIVRNYYAFVGKSEVKHIPLLGYMFAKLHVQVDRAQPNSRAYSLAKSIRTLASGTKYYDFSGGRYSGTRTTADGTVQRWRFHHGYTAAGSDCSGYTAEHVPDLARQESDTFSLASVTGRYSPTNRNHWDDAERRRPIKAGNVPDY